MTSSSVFESRKSRFRERDEVPTSFASHLVCIPADVDQFVSHHDVETRGWPLYQRISYWELCDFSGVLAGMVGFEPTVHCTKNSCLTTWLHPNTGR